MNLNSISVLILSCDKYADLWAPFIQSYKVFWPDCPFKCYLVTNSIAASYNNIETIRVGNDISWSLSLQLALNAISTDYVLLHLEDLFLVKQVNTDRVKATIHACNEDFNYLRLNPMRNGPELKINSLVGQLSSHNLYRASTVVSVWKISTLKKLLVPVESAWEFEIKGSIRSTDFPHFYAANTPTLPIINGVVRGKWTPSAQRTLSRLGIAIDTSKRPVMTMTEFASYRLRQIRSRILATLPSASRRRIRRLFSNI